MRVHVEQKTHQALPIAQIDLHVLIEIANVCRWCLRLTEPKEQGLNFGPFVLDQRWALGALGTDADLEAFLRDVRDEPFRWLFPLFGEPLPSPQEPLPPASLYPKAAPLDSDDNGQLRDCSLEHQRLYSCNIPC